MSIEKSQASSSHFAARVVRAMNCQLKRSCQISKGFVALSAATLLAGSCAVGHATTFYHIAAVGSLGGTDIYPLALNNNGDITGYASDINGEEHPFLWTGGNLLDLGANGGYASRGLAINDAGQVTGLSSISPTQYHGFLWSAGVKTDLGVVQLPDSDPSQSQSRGVAINKNGAIAGSSDVFLPAAGGSVSRAFRWKDGALSDLGTLSSSSYAYTSSEASDINDNGDVVGVADAFTQSSSGRRAFLFRSDTSTLINLGALSSNPFNSYSRAFKINDSRNVIGESSTESGANHQFFRAINRPMIDLNDLLGVQLGFSELMMKDLNSRSQALGSSRDSNGNETAVVYDGRTNAFTNIGVLNPGNPVSAEDINDVGAVVGSTRSPNGNATAYVYRNGTLTDLQPFVPNAANVYLYRANLINNKGQIASLGYQNGQPGVFLMTPVTARLSLSLQPSTAVGGRIVNATVRLNVPAPGYGVTIQLNSSDAAAAGVSFPPSVQIPSGATSATFIVNVPPADFASTVTITATLDAETAATKTLQISPAKLTSFSVPTTMRRNSNASGTIRLDGASTGNYVVNLTSDNPAVSVPGSVQIAPNATGATFVVTSQNVAVPTLVTITASAWNPVTNSVITLNKTITVKP